MLACDKTTPSAEPVGAASTRPGLPAVPAAPAASAPAAKEVPPALGSSAKPGDKEMACAPGGCAPGKCGANK